MSEGAKILKGTIVRGDQLRLPRTRAIFVSASIHPYVTVLSCKIKSDGSEIVELLLNRLEIPDETVYPIQTEEPVAIVCRKQDILLPEVYAIRKDFPTGLPHSNAKAFSHPVSMCVSDVSFTDMRLQFNAYDFIQSIRRWLEKNSINELHETDRPLEVFFSPDDICSIINEPSPDKQYLKYRKLTDRTSTIEFVEKNSATHYGIRIQSNELIAHNLVRIPKTIADLDIISTSNGLCFTKELLTVILNSSNSKLPIIVLLLVKEKRNQISAPEYNGLFAISLQLSIADIKRRLQIGSKETFEKWFASSSINISWLLLPVIREFNASMNGVIKQFNKLCLIGAGTLGSSVVDHVVRMGVCDELSLVDVDYFYPHNFARHILPFNSLMKLKVSGMKNQYEGILGQKIQAISSDVFTLSNNQKSMAYDRCDMIIDMSTSVAVERMLSFDAQTEKIRKCTAFLNPKGNDLVLLMEDSNRYNRIDLLEMSYYRDLITNDELSHHLAVAESQKTNRFSCRSESAIINYDNVGILSSIASQQIKTRASSSNPSIGIWHINETSGTVNLIDVRVEQWEPYKDKDYSVFVCESSMNEIQENTRFAGDNETGGCIFGCYDKDRQIIYVLKTTPAPADSMCTPNSFIRGTEGLVEMVEMINERTYYQVRYLGEWHSHPNSSNNPSGSDDKQFNDMCKKHKTQDIPFVQIIYGNNGMYVRCKM